MAEDNEIFSKPFSEQRLDDLISSSSKLSLQDERIVAKQIGRKPRGVINVVKRCPSNYPQLIMNSPILEDGTPFPTIFWLSCPVLKKLVSRLEESGWIKILKSKIAHDETLKGEFELAHSEYREIKRHLLSKKEKGRKGEMELGICGIKDIGSLKCLHGHYAHYLATGKNPIGRLVDGWIAFNGDCSYCDRWPK